MDSTEDLRKFTLFFTNLPGIGAVTFKKLLDVYGNIENLFKAYLKKDIPQLKTFFSLSEILKNDRIVVLKSKKVEFICLWESEFPTNLKNIYDPPSILFYTGVYKKDQLDNSLSIVGTRSSTSYGLENAYNFSYKLSNVGFGIVSGMAFGIDKQAHRGCLDSKGYTIAVLASSPDVASPSNNKDIYNKILKNDGIIISEYFPGTEVNPGMFVSRNRIVAGISLGTIVIEAGEESGSLITAKLALDYNREVFCIPGNINSAQSRGTNQMVKVSSAKLVMDVSDVLSEFGFASKATNLNTDLLTEEEDKLVYYAILAGRKDIDEICKKICKDVSLVLRVCAKLEIMGIIRRDLSGKFYIS